MAHIERELKKIRSYLTSNSKKQITLVSIEDQLKLFIKGSKVPHVVKPCTIGDGIIQIRESEFSELISKSDTLSKTGRLTKFVPASGAASRMFQKLQSVLNRSDEISLGVIKNESKDDEEFKSVYEFLINIQKFAFYDDLKTVLNVDDAEIDRMINEVPLEILKAVLHDAGLNYSSRPKGAIKFHRYKDECRTAFEEQIYEAFNYAADIDNNVKIHFTISEEHTELFTRIIEQLKSKPSKTDFKVNVTYSYQKKSTDTIAVDKDNSILFDKSGDLILRPGGHGALLENLNDLNGDIIVIKNIDNLSVESLSAETILYKKLLIGYLVKIREKVFQYLNRLEKENLNKEEINEILSFAKDRLNIIQSKKFDKLNLKQKSKILYSQLNRPIRICGMVKNEGEPGGSPFWVKADNGSLSLQIVEQIQINLNDENQKKIFFESTHFNPVDLICSIKDYKGESFDLHDFVDHDGGIITQKAKDGVELKALELPGLWNGGMAYWVTIFVEVPISTFNPVKEINDLLRKAHQN